MSNATSGPGPLSAPPGAMVYNRNIYEEDGLRPVTVISDDSPGGMVFEWQSTQSCGGQNESTELRICHFDPIIVAESLLIAPECIMNNTVQAVEQPLASPSNFHTRPQPSKHLRNKFEDRENCTSSNCPQCTCAMIALRLCMDPVGSPLSYLLFCWDRQQCAANQIHNLHKTRND